MKDHPGAPPGAKGIPATGDRKQGEGIEAGNLTANYSIGKDILRSVTRHGEASVYSLESVDAETLRACGFDPVFVGHGLYVCWEPSDAGGETHA